jgi:hypothetical protein
MRLEGLGKLKKSTSSGLKPATFRLVAEWLNQLLYRVTKNYVAVLLHFRCIQRYFGKRITSAIYSLSHRTVKVDYILRDGL